jgi:phage-related protein
MWQDYSSACYGIGNGFRSDRVGSASAHSVVRARLPGTVSCMAKQLTALVSLPALQ